LFSSPSWTPNPEYMNSENLMQTAYTQNISFYDNWNLNKLVKNKKKSVETYLLPNILFNMGKSTPNQVELDVELNDELNDELIAELNDFDLIPKNV